MTNVAGNPVEVMDLLTSAGLAIVTIDREERITAWDGAAEAVYGYRRDEVLGQSIQSLLWDNADTTGDDLDSYAAIIGGEAAEFRSWRHRRDGSRFLAELHVTPFFDDDGRWAGSTALVRDASAELDLVERVQLAERRFATAFTDAALPLLICDLDSTVIESNEAYRTLTSRVGAEPVTRLLDLIEPQSRPPIAAALSSLAGSPGRFESLEAPLAGRPDHIVSLSIAPVDEGSDAPPLALVQIIDVSHLLRAQAELVERAMTDPLTGALNRWCLENILGELKPGSPVGVLFLDLDNFKLANDRLGHAAGDVILETIGGRLRAVLRDGDAIIRWGGDEFVIICRGLSDPRAAERLGDRLRASVATPIAAGETDVVVTASVGIALTAVDEQLDIEGTVGEADVAMYEAKSLGRNATVV